MTQEERERQSNKEALKAVWKYYVMAFIGIGLIFAARYLSAPVSSVVNVVGALLFFGGVLIVLYWDRKAKKKAMEEIRAEAEAENLKEARKSKKRRK